jgi:hypothetical protein
LRDSFLVAAAVVGCALGAFFLLRNEDLRSVAPQDSDVAAPRVRAADPALRTERKPFSVRRRPPARQRRAGDDGLPATEVEAVPGAGERVEVPAGDYIAALRASGETAGVAAFPPPGTRPARSGILVPPDYQLPEGFARHYQSTDDGRQLAPVLIVAPGFEIVDGAGEPVALEDRIVPPEYAPPDLPVEMLEVPVEPDPGTTAR